MVIFLGQNGKKSFFSFKAAVVEINLNIPLEFPSFFCYGQCCKSLDGLGVVSIVNL